MHRYLIFILFIAISFSTETNKTFIDDLNTDQNYIAENTLSVNISNIFYDYYSELEECNDEESLKHIAGFINKLNFTYKEKKENSISSKIACVFNYSLIDICIDLPPPFLI
ncbi:MAG: hypothetical protein JEY96_09840 [Bacteroidales bacterium]|nr:hypothetical protein [Bacteroidales bacterium]